MADGTVRGRYELDTRPAIRSVRDFGKEAGRADAQVYALGEQIDSAFGTSKAEQVETVARSIKDIGDKTIETRQIVRREWGAMRREIESDSAKMVAAIEAVE